ncbi:transporter [Caulobacter sp. Root655]|uniref:efflux transporter outer membrane subunit n=1 Tax=Caulobacter sp. Root655 TaxID=1736578 RepID=UPI0007001DC4|nr:TolC family protein [Caulobacter sp. Root655]KRA62015.1 transporter [Caulobacter sp. Root655]
MTGERTRPRPLRSGAALAALGLGGLALTACVSTPRPTPDTRLPAAYEAPAGTTLPQASLDRWWTSFNDPQLTALVEAALEKAPDARSAQAVLDEARAVRKGQVRQLYIPSTPLTGSGSKTHTKILDQKLPAGVFPFTQGGDTESYAANFDVSWELDLIGRRRAARQVVDNDLAAARFGFEGARAALAANVAQSYFEARGLAVQLDDARETVRINGGLRDSAVKKGEAGLVATSEGDRAEADMAQAQAQVADLEAQLAVARRSLLILVGRGIDPLVSLPVDAVLDAPPPVPATVPGELLARRPDVREAQAKLASAAGNLKINELALFPTFNLTPGVGLSKSISPSFGLAGGKTETTSSTWTLGANLSIPVLNIPSLLADIDAQNARTRQAAIAYEKAVQTAYGEAENAMVQLNADQRRVTLLTAGEIRAERAYAAGRKGYALGLTDLTTTLQAEQSWRLARTALTGAKTQALLRAVQTYKALGGGWSPNPAQESTVPTQVSSK